MRIRSKYLSTMMRKKECREEIEELQAKLDRANEKLIGLYAVRNQLRA